MTDEDVSLLTLEPLREEFTMVLNECRCNEQYRNIGNIEVGRRLLKVAIEYLDLMTTPVSFAKTSPEDRFLNDKKECWMWRPLQMEWEFCKLIHKSNGHTHWLPYWAFPMPTWRWGDER